MVTVTDYYPAILFTTWKGTGPVPTQGFVQQDGYQGIGLRNNIWRNSTGVDIALNLSVPQWDMTLNTATGSEGLIVRRGNSSVTAATGMNPLFVIDSDGDVGVGIDYTLSKTTIYNDTDRNESNIGLTIKQGNTGGIAVVNYNLDGMSFVEGMYNNNFIVNRGPTIGANPVITVNPNISPLAVCQGFTGDSITLGSTTLAWSPKLGIFSSVRNGVPPYYSTDGRNWTGTGDNWVGSSSVGFANWFSDFNVFLVTANSEIQASTNGTAWNIVFSGTGIANEGNQAVGKIGYSPETKMLVAAYRPTTTTTVNTPILMSRNSLSAWTACNAPMGISAPSSVIWCPKLKMWLIPSGASGTTPANALYSYDGINYSSYLLPFHPSTAGSTLWLPEFERFVSVSTTGAFWYSNDGFNWTQTATGFSTASSTSRALAYSPELRAVVTSFRAFSLDGGLAWTGIDSFSAGVGRAAWSPQLGLFVVQAGNLSRSSISMYQPNAVTTISGQVIMGMTGSTGGTGPTVTIVDKYPSILFSGKNTTGPVPTQGFIQQDGYQGIGLRNNIWRNSTGVDIALSLDVPQWDMTLNTATGSEGLIVRRGNSSITAATGMNPLFVVGPNGDVGVGIDYTLSRTTVYNDTDRNDSTIGLTVKQGNTGGIAVVNYNLDGMTYIEGATNNSFVINRGPKLGANPVFTINPNLLSPTAVCGGRWTGSDIFGVSLAWSPKLSIFSALGPGFIPAFSYDGRTWGSTGAGNIGFSGTAYFEEWYSDFDVFLATAGGQIWASTNGTAWTTVLDDPTIAASATARGKIGYSPETKTFVAAYPPSSTVQSRVFMSRNSISAWTACNAPNIGRPGGVVWSPKLKMWLIPCGSSGTFQSHAIYSYDSINFNIYPLDFQPSYGGVASLWLPEFERFVSLSSTGAIWINNDGFNWSQVATGVNAVTANANIGMGYSPELRTLATSRGRFSTDGGVNWGGTATSSGGLEGTVAWSPQLGIFVLTESSAFYRSSGYAYQIPITTVTGQLIIGITGASGGLTGSTGPTVTIVDKYPSILFSGKNTTGPIPTQGFIQQDGYQGIGLRNNIWRNSTGVDIALDLNIPQWDMTLNTATGSEGLIVRRGNSSITAATGMNPLFVIDSDGDVGIGIDYTLSKTTIYNDTDRNETNIGLTVKQGNTGGIAVVNYNLDGMTYIEGATNTNFMINRGPKLGANPVFTINPNLLSATAVCATTWNSTGYVGTTIAWSPKLGIFSGVGNSSAMPFYSYDGRYWSQTGNSPGNSNLVFESWFSDFDVFLTTGNSQIQASTNGTAWNIVFSGTGLANTSNVGRGKIGYSPETKTFVAAYGRNASSTVTTQVFMSRNSISAWTACNAPSLSLPSNVIWCPKLKMWLIPSGASGTTIPNALYSYDGINYSSYQLPFHPSSGIGTLWLPEYERFVSISSTGASWVSDNGFDWTQTATGSSVSLATVRGLGYSPELRTVITSRQKFSTDGGLSWAGTEVNTGASLGSVAWSPQLGVFVYGETTFSKCSPCMYQTPITTVTGQLIIGITGASGGLTGGTGATVQVIDVRPSIFLNTTIGGTAWTSGGMQQNGNWGMFYRNNVWRDSAGTDVLLNPAYPAWDMVLSTQPDNEAFAVRRSPSGSASLSTFLWINPTSYVGIGTTTPQGKLEIADSSTIDHLVLNNTSATAWAIRDGSTSSLIFKGGGIERMRITYPGNVGINTTVPLCLLAVGAGSLADANVPVQMSAGGGQKYYGVNRTDGSYGALFGWDATWGTHVRSVSSSDVIALVVNNTTQALTITSTGSVLMNVYTTDGTMTFIGGVGKIDRTSDERTKNDIRYFDATSYTYSVGPSGPTAYTSFTGYNSLPRIMALRPAQFKHNGYESKYEGFIAQQVEQHIPFAVDGKKYEYEFKKDKEGTILLDEEKNPILDYDKPRYRGLNTTAITAHTVKAIQELNEYQTKQIDRLTDRVTSLESALEQALNRITALENA